MTEATHRQNKKGITILGATGSIGLSTLDVIARHPDRFEVIALTANSDVEGMIGLCQRVQPAYAVMAQEDAASRLRERCLQLNISTEVLAGTDALCIVAALPEVDYVMAAIVGAAGLLPTLAGARAGKRILLANKEALVMAGDLFMQVVQENKVELLPIDSEHNAIFQCLPAGFSPGLRGLGIEKLLLTASGGPFRTMSFDALAQVTPEQACAHPNWVMGRKISVDSATMMNKGLEVIEACWLFGVTPDQVQVVVHAQSVIHSMVQYADGSVLAQLGNPDMRTPIAYGLGFPQRVDAGVPPLDLFSIAKLEFEAPDFARFPCLKLAIEAAKMGGTMPAILNAANEVAVSAFLDRTIGFLQIANLVEASLSHFTMQPATSLDIVLSADAMSREFAQAWVAKSRKKNH